MLLFMWFITWRKLRISHWTSVVITLLSFWVSLMPAMACALTLGGQLVVTVSLLAWALFLGWLENKKLLFNQLWMLNILLYTSALKRQFGFVLSSAVLSSHLSIHPQSLLSCHSQIHWPWPSLNYLCTHPQQHCWHLYKSLATQTICTPTKPYRHLLIPLCEEEIFSGSDFFSCSPWTSFWGVLRFGWDNMNSGEHMITHS